MGVCKGRCVPRCGYACTVSGDFKIATLGCVERYMLLRCEKLL